MKFTCERAALFAALGNATRAISAHATLDILDCVMLSAMDDQVQLTCTDLMMGIQVSIPADITEEGRVCVPGKLFMEVVRRAPDGFINVACDETTHQLKTKSGESRSTITGRSPDTFPRLLMLKSETPLVVEQATLKSMISQTAHAIALEEARRILTGSLMEVRDGQLFIIALDGFRMALRSERLNADVGGIHIVVPGKSMTEISRILGDEGNVSLHVIEGQLMVEMDSLLMTIRLLEGEYIKYTQIIPANFKTQIVLEKSELEQSLERANLMAREGKNNIVKLHIGDDEMQITSNSEMGDIFDVVGVVKEGADLDIAFNIRFLIDSVKNMPGDKIHMRFGTNISPCVIEPVGAENALFLIIPLRVF